MIKSEIINGELVITYAANKAMPLIRYRTGDFFEVINDDCRCGIPGSVLAWSGRENVDKIRVSGVEIKINDVEDVFNQLNYIIGDQYQIHFYENNEKPAIQIIIEIKEERISAKFLSPENIKTIVINHLMNNWRFSSTANLKNAINKGLFLIPEVKFVEEFSYKSNKIRRLVSHLNSS